MGAEVLWTVRVLVTVEATVEVSAVTSSDALEQAKKQAGVVAVLGIADDVSGVGETK